MKPICMILAALLLPACYTGPVLSQGQMACQVIKFSVADESLCAAECKGVELWRGYSHSTVVPCTWLGKRVTRAVQ